MWEGVEPNLWVSMTRNQVKKKNDPKSALASSQVQMHLLAKNHISNYQTNFNKISCVHLDIMYWHMKFHEKKYFCGMCKKDKFRCSKETFFLSFYMSYKKMSFCFYETLCTDIEYPDGQPKLFFPNLQHSKIHLRCIFHNGFILTYEPKHRVQV